MVVLNDATHRVAAGTVNSDARGEHRLVLFLLSPRVIDFDTFLPTAMQLKETMPAAEIRFVTFSRENYDFIRCNPSLVEGLRRCGTLHLVGSAGAEGLAGRWVQRLRSFGQIAGWILRWPRPLLLAARPFASFPYNLFAFLARLRSGQVMLLWKSRSPDRVHEIIWQNRAPPQKQKRGWSLFRGRDVDAVVHYHQDQMYNLELSRSFGDIDDVPWRTIGFPHLFPAWRRLIDDEIAAERRRLVADGVPEDAELYSMFAAKTWSATNLRSPDAIERVFKQIITALCRMRPKAVVLIRPHPLAINDAYIKEAIALVGGDRARVSFVHPEVLLALSRRALFNNPTNVMFSCFKADMIDCSDYAERHYEERGHTSLADGYGPLFIDPRSPDFEAQLKRALDDDALFEDGKLGKLRDDLLDRNPPNIGALTSLFREGRAAQAA